MCAHFGMQMRINFFCAKSKQCLLFYTVYSRGYHTYTSMYKLWKYLMACLSFMYESIIKYPGFSQRFILHRFIDANPAPDNEMFDSVINSIMIVCNFVLCIYSIITLIHSDYSKDYTPQHYSTCMQSTINIEGLLGFFKNSCLQKM
jgi:hypothetical protein